MLDRFDKCTSDFLDMLTDLQFDTATKNYILRKIITITKNVLLHLLQIKQRVAKS